MYRNLTFTYTKVEPNVVRENRKFFQRSVKKAFIKYCAYQGYFDSVLTKEEIKKAKKGTLPEWCSVHHMRPLSGQDEGCNDFSNLTVISNTEHKRINKNIYAPQIRPIEFEPYGTQTVITVPYYDYVDEVSLVRDRPNKLKTYEIIKNKNNFER